MVTIRKATNADLQTLIEFKKTLLDFYNSIGNENNSHNHIEKYITKALRNDIFLLAEIDGEVVGMIKLSRQHQLFCDAGENYMIISDFIIKDDVRNHGIGTALFNEVQNIAKNQNYKKIRLSVKHFNKNAFNFYVNKGFKVVSLNMILDL